MTRARRWRIAAIGGRVLVALFVAGAAVTDAWWHVRECTYYGAHSNLLRIGERVAFSKEFQAAGGHSITKSQAGIVQEGPAWDEDRVRLIGRLRLRLLRAKLFPCHVMSYIVSKSCNQSMNHPLFGVARRC